MPYTLKTHQISVKDPETGEYSGVDILVEQTEQGLIAELQAEGTTQVNRINQAAVDVQAAVDQAENDAATIISNTQTSINTLEAQKNTIAQTVASMAELGTDTTLSTPGMAADAGAVGDLSRHLSDSVDNSINLLPYYAVRETEFDISRTENGYFISDDNDNTNTNETYKHTTYIAPIIPGIPYALRCCRKIKTYLDGVFQSTLSGVTNGYTTIVFSGINGIRVDYTASYENNVAIYALQNNISNSARNYNLFFPYIKDSDMVPESIEQSSKENYISFDALEHIELFTWNVVDNNRLIYNAQFLNDGSIVPYFHDTIIYAVSDFSKVTPGETLYFNGSIHCYGSNKEFLRVGNTTSAQYVVPDDTYYIRVDRSVYKTAYESDPTSIYAYIFRRGYGLNNLACTSTEPKFSGFPIFKDEYSLNGFKNYLKIFPYGNTSFAFIGDSFSAPGQWQQSMCNVLHADIAPSGNRARGGGSFSTFQGYVKTAYEQAQELVANNVVFDFICVFLGVNDLGKSSIGEFVETTNIEELNLSTFYGGVQACITYLQNHFPDAVIFIGFTPAGNNFGTIDNSSYLEALKYAANKYGVQYVDTLVSGITRLSTVYADCWEAGTAGGHPTALGHQRIGKAMARKMLFSCGV